MPQLGPEYSLAQDLAGLRDKLARLEANPLGQAFGSLQGDGTRGFVVEQVDGGNVRLIFYQGVDTARDVDSGQHPPLLYLGPAVAAGQSVNNVAIFTRPDGTQILVMGQGGFTLFDAQHKIIFSPDEAAGEGIARPWIPLPSPRSNVTTNWQQTTSTSLTDVAVSDVNLQHPKVEWKASASCPAGVTGEAQIVFTNGAVGQVWPLAANSFTDIDDVISMPAGFFGSWVQAVVRIRVASGTGTVSINTFGLYGRQT